MIAFPALVFAQLSPGDLTKAHEHLEGLSNCTKCHVLGEKVTNEKCLDCHTEIQHLIKGDRGYHASEEVEGKDCFACHSEHHGQKFEMVRFDQENFNHELTGFRLAGKHREIKCEDCHKQELIQQGTSQKKDGNTFLGLGTKCLDCHKDYHQQTLDENCLSCHNQDAFVPAAKFEHQKTDFPLKGKHQKVDCEKCHQKEEREGVAFQKFANVEFANCTACHEDVHENKFGQNCVQCHSEESFHEIANRSNFDHRKTGYPLKGKHQKVDCNKCHKQNYTDPIAHNQCKSCHSDYHKGQFTLEEGQADCDECHSVNRFTPSLFSIEKHNQTKFKLAGAHLATPCFMCHKKTEEWEFRKIGSTCVDCHENIHEGHISEKYMPVQQCNSCHNVTNWGKINFDHRNTNFELIGKHAQTACRDCHFKADATGRKQYFAGLSTQCETCHSDVHRGQFNEKEETKCERCHLFDDWKAERFDHDRTQFVLEGAHQKVDCQKCHPPVTDPSGTYIQYEFKKDIKCASCHSSS